MRRLLPLFIMTTLLGGCAAAIKPSESLDQRTGMTVGALQQPIEFVERGENAAFASRNHSSFAYLGPVEWDASGDITYGLWIHVVPGSDRAVVAIRSAGAVRLRLDDEATVLTPAEPPGNGLGPYRPIASWGQTSYFTLDVSLLRRMAASRTLELEFKGVDAAPVTFVPTRDTQTVLRQFLLARGITAD